MVRGGLQWKVDVNDLDAGGSGTGGGGLVMGMEEEENLGASLGERVVLDLRLVTLYFYC